MMYLHETSLAKLKRDVTRFVGCASLARQALGRPADLIPAAAIHITRPCQLPECGVMPS